MRDKKGIYENEVEPSTGASDHQIDLTLINKQDTVDTEEEARG